MLYSYSNDWKELNPKQKGGSLIEGFNSKGANRWLSLCAADFWSLFFKTDYNWDLALSTDLRQSSNNDRAQCPNMYANESVLYFILSLRSCCLCSSLMLAVSFKAAMKKNRDPWDGGKKNSIVREQNIFEPVTATTFNKTKLHFGICCNKSFSWQ